MTRDQLCSLIARKENKKVSISIGNVREVLRILIDLQLEHNLSDESLADESPLVVLHEAVKEKETKLLAKKKAKK